MLKMKRLLFFALLLPLTLMADIRYDYYFQEATSKRLAGKLDEAVALYEHCLRLDGRRPEALFELGRLQIALKEDSLGIEMMRQAADMDSLNANYQENVAAVMLRRMMNNEAVTYLERLSALRPSRSEVKMQLAKHYGNIGNWERALEILDAIDKREGRSVETAGEKFSIYMIDCKDSVRAFQQFEELCKERPYDVMALIQCGRLYQYYGDTLRANQFFEEARRVGPTETELALLRSDAVSLLQREAPGEEVVKVLKKILELQPDDENVMGYLMEYYGKKEDYEQLEEICRRGVNLYPENLGYSYFLGITLMQQKRFENAIEVFRKGLEKRGEGTRPSLISEVWGLKGDACHEVGRYDEAFAAFDSALVYNKDNVAYLNNYAYYLSLREERLDEAAEMSRRTLKAAPDNPIYLDTYAWIMFISRQYDEAERVMYKVVPPDSTDEYLLDNKYCMSNVLEHAGDIAWMQGKEEDALRFWRLAMKRDDKTGTPLLPKKVRKKKYYAK